MKRATGARWVADLRDPLVVAPAPARRRVAARAAEGEGASAASRSSSRRRPTRSSLRPTRSPRRCARLDPKGRRDDRERLRLRRLRRPRVPPRATSSASRMPAIFFGKRDPQPFLTALAESGSTTSSCGSPATSATPTASTPRALGLGDRIELLAYVPRRRSLELQRDSEALLLLIPDAGRPRQGRADGQDLRVPRRRAPDPRRRAARRRRRRPAPRDGRRHGRRARRRRRDSRRAPRPSPPLEGREPRRNAALAGVARAPLARQARRRARRRVKEFV